MNNTQVIEQVQALYQLVMTNYDRPDWTVMISGDDAKAVVKLDIFLQDVLDMAERKLHVNRWSVPSNSTSDYYDVIQLHDGSLECECKGFRYRRECPHVEFILDTELDERQAGLFPRSEAKLPNKYRLNVVLNALLSLMEIRNGKYESVEILSLDDLMVGELYALLSWLDQNGGATAALREVCKNPQEWAAVLRDTVGSIERGWTAPPAEEKARSWMPTDTYARDEYVPPPVVDQPPLFEDAFCREEELPGEELPW